MPNRDTTGLWLIWFFKQICVLKNIIKWVITDVPPKRADVLSGVGGGVRITSNAKLRNNILFSSN